MEEIALAVLIVVAVSASLNSDAMLFIGSGLMVWGALVYWSTPNGLYDHDRSRAFTRGRKDSDQA